MKYVTRIDRGRRYYSDKPSSSVMVNMTFEGSVLTEQHLARLVRDGIRYIKGRYGDGGPPGVPA